MPLSEREERILAEIERQLAAEDPKFFARVRRRPLARAARLRLALVLAILGTAAVLCLVFSLAIAAVGMVMLLTALVLAVTAMTESPARDQVVVPPDERA